MSDNERAYWDSLTGQDAIDNTVGIPPYDVEEVACRIRARLPDDDPLTPPGQLRILDLGCGQGRLMNHMAEQWPWEEFHGVDISREMLAVAAANSRHLDNTFYWIGDGRTLPIGGPFDLAYSVTMFQHIPHDAKLGYILDVRQALKPGGVFVFTVALGDTDEFLNHQIPDQFAFMNQLHRLFAQVNLGPDDSRGWTWCYCRKAA